MISGNKNGSKTKPTAFLLTETYRIHKKMGKRCKITRKAIFPSSDLDHCLQMELVHNIVKVSAIYSSELSSALS